MDLAQFQFAFTVFWVCLSAFLYGYQISALNSLQAALTCDVLPQRWILHGLTTSCISITKTQFGVLSSMYTIGGLIGALQGGRLADSRGRKRSLVLAAALMAAGSFWMAIGSSLSLMIVGRLLLGFGCGISTVVVPMFLHQISPPHLKGSIGVLNQLSITIGIVTALALGIPFSKPSIWRFVLVIYGCIAGLQLLLSMFIREPPSNSEEFSRNGDVPRNSELEGLLPSDNRNSRIPLTTWQAITSHDQSVKSALYLIVATQIAQQLSGINAVFNYSTETLRQVVPANPQVISLAVSGANCVMTIVPALLIERVGRRQLLIFSMICCALSTMSIGIGLNANSGALASIATVAFVSTFSVGLGALPFLLIPEVAPSNAVSAASSLGLGLNWISNAIVGVTFNPLAQALAPTFGVGGIFYLFSLLTCLAAAVIWRLFVPLLSRKREAER